MNNINRVRKGALPLVWVLLFTANLLSQQPTVEQIAPEKGIIGFPQTVLIKGTNFHNPLQVFINGQPADFQIVSERFLAVEVPAGIGTETITIINTSGTIEVPFERIPPEEADFVNLIGRVQGLIFDMASLMLDLFAFELFSIGEQPLPMADRVKALNEASQKWQEIILRMEQAFKKAIAAIKEIVKKFAPEKMPWITAGESTLGRQTEFLRHALAAIGAAAQQQDEEAKLWEKEWNEKIVVEGKEVLIPVTFTAIRKKDKTEKKVTYGKNGAAKTFTLKPVKGDNLQEEGVITVWTADIASGWSFNFSLEPGKSVPVYRFGKMFMIQQTRPDHIHTFIQIVKAGSAVGVQPEEGPPETEDFPKDTVDTPKNAAKPDYVYVFQTGTERVMFDFPGVGLPRPTNVPVTFYSNYLFDTWKIHLLPPPKKIICRIQWGFEMHGKLNTDGTVTWIKPPTQKDMKYETKPSKKDVDNFKNAVLSQYPKYSLP